MGLYGFKKRFVPYIVEGSKTHAIRAVRCPRDKPGNTMHLYTGLRQKGAVLLGRFPCIKVEQNPITEDHRVFVDEVELDRDEKDLLAWRDGFRLDATVFALTDPPLPKHTGCFEMLMMAFWSGRLPFEGHIYHWKWSK
jgi:hypothetical protein